MEYIGIDCCDGSGLEMPFYDEITNGINSKETGKNVYLYQSSGAGGTHSPPATPHRLQHLTARLIQNGQQGLEKG